MSSLKINNNYSKGHHSLWPFATLRKHFDLMMIPSRSLRRLPQNSTKHKASPSFQIDLLELLVELLDLFEPTAFVCCDWPGKSTSHQMSRYVSKTDCSEDWKALTTNLNSFAGLYSSGSWRGFLWTKSNCWRCRWTVDLPNHECLMKVQRPKRFANLLHPKRMVGQNGAGLQDQNRPFWIFGTTSMLFLCLPPHKPLWPHLLCSSPFFNNDVTTRGFHVCCQAF